MTALKNCVFDAFGTLFQTAAFEYELEQIMGADSDNLIRLWRQKQLEYTWLYNQMNKYMPFDEITRRALLTAMNTLGTKDNSILSLLLPIFDNPNLIEGAKYTLSHLKTQGKKIFILSNGTPQMLQNGVIATGVGNLIDAIISVDAIKHYKPDPRVYQLAVDMIADKKESCLFVSSNQWDVAGANAFGWEAIWVNQHNETKEELPFTKMTEIAALPDLLEF